jgi:hypothetical protein
LNTRVFNFLPIKITRKSLVVSVEINVLIVSVGDKLLINILTKPILSVKLLIMLAVFTIESDEIKVRRQIAGNACSAIEIWSIRITGQESFIILRHGIHKVRYLLNVRVFQCCRA